MTTSKINKQQRIWLAIRVPHYGLLESLAELCYEFTPYIEIYPPEDSLPKTESNTYPLGLLLELSRSLKLFKGLSRLCQALNERLQNQFPEEPFFYGLAHTAAAAWLLALKKPFDNTVPITHIELDKTNLQQILYTLPIEILPIPAQTLESLQNTGFETLGDIATQIEAASLAPLRKRFGSRFCLYLSDLFDIENNLEQKNLFEKPLTHYRIEPFFQQHQQFDYPVQELEHLQEAIRLLLFKLLAYLDKNHLNTRHISWRIYDIYQNNEQLDVHCMGSRENTVSHQLLFNLSLIQFDATTLPFAVDTLELQCHDTFARQQTNRHFVFSGEKYPKLDDLEVTLAKLRARLGEQAIYKVSYEDSYLPEKNSIAISVDKVSNAELPVHLKASSLPTWLFSQPMPISSGNLQLILGPERIEGEWWNSPCTRDYFVAERDDSLRMWVFYDLDKASWFAHGVF